VAAGTDFVTELGQHERSLCVAGGTMYVCMSLILTAVDSNKITTLLHLCGYYQRFGKSLCPYFYVNKKECGRPKLTRAEGIKGLLGEKGLMGEDWNDRSNWRKKII
jgi:hypothetical protein